MITKRQIQHFLKKNKCPKCSSTTNITKAGKRYNVGEDIQVFHCRNGGHFFSISLETVIEFQYENSIR